MRDKNTVTVAQMTDLADAKSYEFERSWSVFIKPNNTNWSVSSFLLLTTITNIQNLWELLNADMTLLTSAANVFVMQAGLVPLWEEHKDIFAGGGCWSTIVRGETWSTVLTEMTLALVGEHVFDYDDVKGVCIVPVGKSHTLVKLWVRSTTRATAAALDKTLAKMRNVDSRFKAFV